METRKVYVSGGSTYVFSLPKKWVKRNNLKAGESLAVTDQGGSLLIETSLREGGSAVKGIAASQFASSDALTRMLVSLYLAGYDTINIRLDRKDIFRYREAVRNILAYLMGIELVEDTDKSMTLEVIVDHRRMMTFQILQRMFHIDESMLSDIGRAIKERDVGLAKDVMAREKEVDRLYFLVVRQLENAVVHQQVAEKLGIKSQGDCLGYRLVVKVLERIADHIENIAEIYTKLSELQKAPQTDEFVSLINSIVTVFGNSVRSLLARNGDAAEGVFQELEEIKKSCSAASRYMFRIKDIQSAILQKTMLDSLDRIVGYTEDIAEIAIDMSVEVS